MLHSIENVIRHKIGLLNLAEELDNVSKACKIMGVSRDTFYRYKEAVESDGVEALIDYAVEQPVHGQVRASNELRNRGIFVSPTGVRGAWLRHDLETFKKRLKALEANGIRERFHKTIHDEFYCVAFRKKIYEDLQSLQHDLDEWIHYYNYERTHQGKMCCGRTPMETLEDGKQIWQEKKLN